MVKNEPVSLTRQTIYCIIPILDIYAAYRVKRLRRYLLIMISIGFVVGIADSNLISQYTTVDANDFTNYVPFLVYKNIIDDPVRLVFAVIQQIGFTLLAIYLVRRWSKHWNKKFEDQEFT